MARILFLGQLFDGSTGLSRAHALRSLGHDVEALEAYPREAGATHLVRAVRRRTGLGPAHPINRELLAAAARWRPQVVWVEKGIHVSAAALIAVRKLLPGVKLVHYTCDRTAVPGNRSRDMLAGFPQYDLAATTVREEVDYLRRLGARRAVRTWHGFDPALFRPPSPDGLDRTLSDRLVFVGAWEAERARTLAALVDAGLPVTIVSLWKQWHDVATRPGDVEWRRTAVYGTGYPVLLASGAVGLGFLRKLSRDQHTQRSFEIPASGGLLVAERTPEHLELFQEGVEAEFFADDAECVEKCRSLLADASRRRALAAAGRLRVERSGYTWADRVALVLGDLGFQRVP